MDANGGVTSPRQFAVPEHAIPLWRARLQVLWVGVSAAITYLAIFQRGGVDWARREELLLASLFGVIVFGAVLLTVLVARSEAPAIGRQTLVVALSASLFVIGASWALEVWVTVAAAGVGAVQLAAVALASDAAYRGTLETVTMTLGLPALMASAGLIAHAALVYLPGFDENVLFFPTTMATLSGLMLAILHNRYAEGDAGVKRPGWWWRAVLVAVGLAGAGVLAFKQPHGWPEEERGAVSLAIAACWLIIVLIPTYAWLARRLREADAGSSTDVARWLANHWVHVAAVALAAGAVHALVGVNLIGRKLFDLDDGSAYDLGRSVVVESATAFSVWMGGIGSAWILARLKPVQATSPRRP